MSRVLLLMTSNSYRAGAFLDAARALGVEVVAGTDRPQALEGLNPAGHLTLDFDDVRDATRAIVEFAARHPLDAVLATDDEGVVLAAMAAEALGLRHHAPAAVRTRAASSRAARRSSAPGSHRRASSASRSTTIRRLWRAASSSRAW